MLEYAPSQTNKTVQHAVLKTVANGNADSDMTQKIHVGRLFVRDKRIWMEKKRIDVCRVSDGGIFNMCDISYEMLTSLNFSFKFGRIILTLFNIKPV